MPGPRNVTPTGQQSPGWPVSPWGAAAARSPRRGSSSESSLHMSGEESNLVKAAAWRMRHSARPRACLGRMSTSLLPPSLARSVVRWYSRPSLAGARRGSRSTFPFIAPSHSRRSASNAVATKLAATAWRRACLARIDIPIWSSSASVVAGGAVAIGPLDGCRKSRLRAWQWWRSAAILWSASSNACASSGSAQRSAARCAARPKSCCSGTAARCADASAAHPAKAAIASRCSCRPPLVAAGGGVGGDG
eukprot:scaffold131341_cov31-Tisochrysis_lutea.AAC.14